jgi:hypothetical protein
MPNLTNYINGFFGIGSKATVKANQRDLLIRLLSYEIQTLTTEQKIQVLTNLGISIDSFGKSGEIALIKGTRTITFATAFTAPYTVVATGSTATAAVSVFITDNSNLASFTIKIAADCTVRWSANLIT